VPARAFAPSRNERTLPLARVPRAFRRASHRASPRPVVVPRAMPSRARSRSYAPASTRRRISSCAVCVCVW
jgi:hypothetical protein